MLDNDSTADTWDMLGGLARRHSAMSAFRLGHNLGAADPTSQAMADSPAV